VVTRGLDRCLFLYPMAAWEELAAKLVKLPISQSKSRAFARLMLAGAMECSIDKQGRVILPEYLRDYADLNKKVVVAGLYDRIELWDEGAWKKYKSATEKDSNDIAEALGELGV
jgi:MraZ protein